MPAQKPDRPEAPEESEDPKESDAPDGEDESDDETEDDETGPSDDEEEEEEDEGAAPPPSKAKEAAEAKPEGGGVAATPKKSEGRTRSVEDVKAEARAKASKERTKVPPAPKRPELDAETRRLLAVRRTLDEKRPLFVRQASHRYERIGRWESWRTPRGIQSKQRRHYKYRAAIVRVGYRSPARVRGLTPTGFRPVLVATRDEIEALDGKREAAVIARAVGTRRRIALEEVARRRGVHVLNPLVRGEAES